MSYEALIDPASAGDLDALAADLTQAVAAGTQQASEQRGSRQGLVENPIANDGVIREAPADHVVPADTGPQKPEWIEDKFWTGDVEESAAKQHAAYQNLQTAYGRMANDLGTQRQLTDRLLNVKRTDDLVSNTPEPVRIESGADLIDRPNETLDDFLRPRLDASQQALNERLDRIESALGQNSFATKHPDYQQIGNDPAFVQWVNQSPYRARAAQEALQGDWDAADMLMSEYKLTQRQPAPQPNNGVSANGLDNAGVEAARQVGLESAAQAGSTNSTGREYRRADLIRLKVEKPHIYEDPRFQAEIMKAYAEGRVK